MPTRLEEPQSADVALRERRPTYALYRLYHASFKPQLVPHIDLQDRDGERYQETQRDYGPARLDMSVIALASTCCAFNMQSLYVLLSS